MPFAQRFSGNKLDAVAALLRFGGRICAWCDAWLLLVTRVWLAQAFLLLQIKMLMSGQSLAANLGSAWWVTLVHDVTAGSLGGAIQALCPLLLVLGLLTRPTAVAMLLQVVLLRYDGERAALHVFWAVLLVGLIVRGPGLLSLDRTVGSGIANSAIPGISRVARTYRRFTAVGTPIFLFGLRGLIALVLLVPHTGPGPHAGTASMAQLQTMVAMLPSMPGMIAALPSLATVLLATALLVGLAVRPIDFVLMLLAPVGAATFSADAFYWLLLLGFLLAEGGGRWALDRVIDRALSGMARVPGPDAHRVVIVGGGFSGHAVARGLGGSACHVTLIDRRNYHLFQPLLYQVATAALSPGDIAMPIRGMVRDHTNILVFLGTVDGVDRAAKQVCLGDARIGYDTLVLATGARHSYFGHDEWSGLAPGLKTIEDATDVRRRLLIAFEAAEATDDAAERQAWLTFVIVGGGPTGVELAGAIAELARFGMEGEFRRIDPATARVVLVQSAERLLPTFHEASSREAAAALKRLGVEVFLDERANEIDERGVRTKTGAIASRTVLWAAGVEASPAARWLGADADRAGRVIVGPDLRVQGCGDIFAIGDTCASKGWKGNAVPGLAPAAKQAGSYVAQAISRQLNGKPAPKPFVYNHYGNLATIGRKAAVAEFGRFRVKGAPAWWLWGAAHVFFLVGGRSRLGVVIEWLWDYFTVRKGTRLIIGASSLASKTTGS